MRGACTAAHQLQRGLSDISGYNFPPLVPNHSLLMIDTATPLLARCVNLPFTPRNQSHHNAMRPCSVLQSTCSYAFTYQQHHCIVIQELTTKLIFAQLRLSLEEQVQAPRFAATNSQGALQT
jgi:hypothetical protein